MIRVLGFLLIVFALGLGFAWLADRPGDMVVTFDGYQYRLSLMVAAASITAIVAAVMLVWWLVKSIWTSPQAVNRYFRVRKRDRGYQALSTGLIAAGSGDAETARRMKQQAIKLINSDQEPLINLLDAQASFSRATTPPRAKSSRPCWKIRRCACSGCAGFIWKRSGMGEREVAQHYAERAAQAAPQLGWASTAALEARTAQRDWDAGLRLLDGQRSTRQIERDAGARQKAVLLTAKAFDVMEADPMAARNAALEANRLAPDLVPAAIASARALFRLKRPEEGCQDPRKRLEAGAASGTGRSLRSGEAWRFHA